MWSHPTHLLQKNQAWGSAPQLFPLPVVAPGCSPEGAGAELGMALLPDAKVRDDFMCPFSVRRSVLEPGRAAWAVHALCFPLAANESSGGGRSVRPRPGTGEARGARGWQKAAPSPPRPRFYCPASLLLCLQARRFIGFPMNSFKEKVITLSHAG